MKIAYLDCFAGISGDMTLGALVDAGLPLDTLKEDLALLALKGYTIKGEEITKEGIRGTKIRVITEEQDAHRHLSDIKKIIQESSLPEEVKEDSIAIFTRLAEAEAKIHGTTPEKIHFHEVGAMDAILDIVGAVCGFRRLGIEEVYASPVRTGTGFVQCAHGLLPVPAPATLELLQGVPVYGGNIAKELVTPTGAAILSHYVKEYGSLPEMEILQTGYGAGDWDLPIANLLRLIIGKKKKTKDHGLIRFGGAGEIQQETVLMMETNLDDMNPEYYQYLTELLFQAGALDVSLVPVQMKKNRPGTILKVLMDPHVLAACQQIIFRQTTAIGHRVYPVEKYMLPYEIIALTGPWGSQPLRVKIARLGKDIVNIGPEYEDCRRIALHTGLPLKEVYDNARQLAMETVNKENS